MLLPIYPNGSSAGTSLSADPVSVRVVSLCLRMLTFFKGLLGIQMVVDLHKAGAPAEAIRVVDLRAPQEEDLPKAFAGQISVEQADMTSDASLRKAYNAAWPSSVAKLPLTVFHVASVIRPYERLQCFYHRLVKPNIDGAALSMAAARDAGAGLFIYTSSAHVYSRRVRWREGIFSGRVPGFFQLYDGKDFKKPLLQDSEYANNYARSKAVAERMVCEGDDHRGMRTGALRPGNAILGQRDVIFANIMATGNTATFSRPWAQHYVYVGNVSLAHLQYEVAMLSSEHVDNVAARPWLITDKGKALYYKDCYRIFDLCLEKGLKVAVPPPGLLMAVAHMMEAYDVFRSYLPFFGQFLPFPGVPTCFLQPGTVDAAVNMVVDDSESRKTLEDGGIGYSPAYDSLQGICDMVTTFNEKRAASKA